VANLNDLLDALDKENVKGLTVGGDLIGTLADFSGAIGAVQLTISAIESIFASDDGMKDALAAIQAGFNQLGSQFAASDKLQKMRDIDEAIDPAVGVFEQLPAILATVPAVDQNYRLSQIQICEDAVIAFTDDESKWLAAQAHLPYYSDDWSGTLAPEPGSDGLVFNYTYTLPQFLRAIYILLTAIRALEPDSLSYYQVTLSRCLQRLESVHLTIVTSGIVESRIPGLDDVGTAPSPDASGFVMWTTNWAPGPTYWPYGAVEIYSGASNTSSYLTDHFNYFYTDLSLWWTVNANNFLTLLRFRLAVKMKALYIQLGMPAVRQVIDQLRQLTGQPPITDAPYEKWTIDEVAGILGLTLPELTAAESLLAPWMTEPIRLEPALSSFLGQTPPYSSFYVWQPGTGFDDPGSIVPVPAIPLPSEPIFTFLTGYAVAPTNLQS
jgi:hypothetical protein